MYAYMKHFAMNDQQLAQNEMLCTWSTEQAIRRASHNILYTVVNSRAYAPENLNPGLVTYQIILIVVDVIAAVILIVCEALIIKKYLKKQ